LIIDKGIDQERDLLGELLIIAQLMITGGEAKESEKFERSSFIKIRVNIYTHTF
jgi:hypothetical protein